jgi:hypothetical protein
MQTLAQWLDIATRGLAPESASQVRTEIQQHYDAACAASPGDALAALGDPKQANREYCKVLLTEREALLAPALVGPPKRSFSGLFVPTAILAVLFLALYRRPLGSSAAWAIVGLCLIDIPVRMLFPPTTKERSRRYLIWSGARMAAIALLALWDNMAWWAVGALPLALLPFASIDYRRWIVFRKLHGAPPPPLVFARHPSLTTIETIFLKTLRDGSPGQSASIVALFAILAGSAYWQPLTFAPFAVAMLLAFLLPRFLPIYTPERSRFYQIAKWMMFAVAAILPPLMGARAPWIGAAELAFFFWMFETKRIALRRKLPVEEWPKELYR